MDHISVLSLGKLLWPQYSGINQTTLLEFCRNDAVFQSAIRHSPGLPTLTHTTTMSADTLV